MEVPLSSPEGLYLRDVIDRLDALRGKGMARMYSWASKRTYRNGFVWHDLTDDDYVHPVAGREYVLKGTERLNPPTMQQQQLPLLDAVAAASSCSSGSQETAASSSSGWEQHGQRKGAGAAEYRVYRAEDRAAAAADAATQTDDGCRGRGRQRRAQEELGREETSPPTASTSPDTLETLIKADGLVLAAVTTTGGDGSRARASSVLMQLISCGSVSVKGGLATPVMPRGVHHHYRPRPPRAPAHSHAAAATLTPTPTRRQKVVEDKEYFSGSLVETQRSAAADDACQDVAVLRRSSSYNADRALKAEEAVDQHDRCIPRRPKSKRDGYQYQAISGGAKRIGG
ncbi:protein SOSEKI 5-like [Lolium rigidum]|uniref:protein SOSEKI 5-like n=1 Tax=Lolium rigidum TaxID=89674 RepID=UPI001F5D7E8C|nr:protein SOSEKI 5-like [Lolium rigidum]